MKDLDISPSVLDADVVIDYLKSNRRIIAEFAKKINRLHIPSPNLREISQLGRKDAEKLGIILFEPSLDQLKEASQRGGSLSSKDKLCFAVARDQKWICVTNDKKLRKKCIVEKVEIAWGFDLMLKLNQVGLLQKTEARDTANKIESINSHITAEIVSRFVEKLK